MRSILKSVFILSFVSLSLQTEKVSKKSNLKRLVIASLAYQSAAVPQTNVLSSPVSPQAAGLPPLGPFISSLNPVLPHIVSPKRTINEAGSQYQPLTPIQESSNDKKRYIEAVSFLFLKLISNGFPKGIYVKPFPSEEAIRNKARADVIAIERSCLNRLSKRTTFSPFCTDLQSLAEEIEKRLTQPSLQTNDPFLESEIRSYEEMRKSPHVSHHQALSVLKHKLTLISDVTVNFQMSSHMLEGGILTEVYDSDGKSIRYWSALGAWEQYVRTEPDRLVSNIESLNDFLQYYFPNGKNGGITNFNVDGIPENIRNLPNFETEIKPALIF